MNQERISQLYALFRTLPQEVKDRVSSDEAHEALASLSRTLVLEDAQAAKLPLLVLRLVTQDLAPEAVKGEVGRELAVAADLAERITAEVKNGVLAPVSQALMFTGVDISRLGLDASATTSAPRGIPFDMPAGIQPIQSRPAEKEALTSSTCGWRRMKNYFWAPEYFSISLSIRKRPRPSTPAILIKSRMEFSRRSSSCCSATYHCRKLNVE